MAEKVRDEYSLTSTTTTPTTAWRWCCSCCCYEQELQCWSGVHREHNSSSEPMYMLVSKFTEVLRAVRRHSAHECDRTDRASARCASVALIRRYDRVPLAAPIRLSWWPTSVGSIKTNCLAATPGWINSLLWFMTGFGNRDPCARAVRPSRTFSTPPFRSASACDEHRPGVRCRLPKPG